MESVTNNSYQNRFNTLIARHRTEEAKSASASGIEEEYTELRGLMGDIMSDFDSGENEKSETKKKTNDEAESKECAGAVVRDSAMQRLKERRAVESKAVAKTEPEGEWMPRDSKETPTKTKNAILVSLVPLMESQVEQTRGVQDILREDMNLRRQQHEDMLAVRKRERTEEYAARRAQRDQEFKFRQAQMEAESRRISLMVSMLSQPQSERNHEEDCKKED